ncbi:hypothetical protein [Janthinobacterium sp. B9-8]|uniref:hypothetical protein n=1 Tax=Janthinobacterium sp. B9-8 TaxID=1236179 RepID=UPI00061CE7BB|nr:hypothetical protein [Janthinobacterium sp. B9-8]AMC36970.1 hypothetical protein VN23_04315 [Janthinobacterium sp. B9-8]
MSAIAGNFFPPEYKSFPFKEGDLLSSQSRDGKFSVSKILKIDRVKVKKGASINIQGKVFVAPEDDFLLIVSCAYGKPEFASLEEAKAAARAGTWHISIAHAPNRSPGAQEGQVVVSHKVVEESELTGYRQWKAAFDREEAGVF